MAEILKAMAIGSLTFAATNIDDIFILMLFFSQSATLYPRRAIVAGQYIGFTALVLISLFGFLAGLVVPRPHLGFLGLLPILLGVRAWLNRNKEEENVEKGIAEKGNEKSARNSFSSILAVAAVTVANGGDNIGIYTPLFAGSKLSALLVMLTVFYILLGVWCCAGYAVSKQPHIAHILTDYAHYIVPFVLVALGIFIMYESDSLALFWQ